MTRRDDGQREVLDHQEDVVAQLAEGFAFRLGHGGHGADVGTGHEALVAGAGEDHAAHGVLVDGLEGSLQVSQHFGVQGVERLGTVDRHNGDGVLDFGIDKGHFQFLRNLHFHDGGAAHAAADAEGSQALVGAAMLHGVEQGDQDTGTGSAHGMTQGDGAAVDVDLAHVELQVMGNGQALGREGLVGLDEVHIGDGQAGLGHDLAGSGDGADTHDGGIHAAQRAGNPGGHGG